jgi:alkylhydroperoxidase family enzyme
MTIPAGTTPRIAPLEPPFDEVTAEGLRKMMPRGTPPEAALKLFRTFHRNPGLANAMGGLGGHVLGRRMGIGLRDRELAILRACARCGCEYEWGVHVAYFSERAGLDQEQVTATVHGSADDGCWSETDALVIRLVDELHDNAEISDALWEALTHHWSHAQIMELMLVGGWYHAISFIANGARVDREEGASRFPAANT